MRQFSDTLIAERGVRHGKLNIIALEAEHHHAHDEQGEPMSLLSHPLTSLKGSPDGGLGEHAWIEVIQKMDGVSDLLQYEVALEEKTRRLRVTSVYQNVLASMSDILLSATMWEYHRQVNASLCHLLGKVRPS